MTISNYAQDYAENWLNYFTFKRNPEHKHQFQMD